MTSLRVHPRCAAIPYGAAELKQVYYRNFSAALLISSLLHVGIVVAFLMTPSPARHATGGFRPRPEPPVRDFILVPPPPLYPPVSAGGSHKGEGDVRKGTVVTAADNDENIRRTLASQEHMNDLPLIGEGKGNGGTVGETGEGGERRIIIDETEGKELYMVEVEPVILSTVKPTYPSLAILSDLEGKVWVKMLVGKDGRVVKVMVIKSTHEIFEETALEAARGFVFKPGYMSGGPVAVWVSVPFTFKLTSAQ